jgi:3-oxoacyl-[acyl-carrier protein] reductase
LVNSQRRNSLQGHRVLVTGGSRGIGAGIVQLLADEGAQVAFTFSSREESARQILEKLPGEGHFCLQMNIADEASVENGLKQVFEKWPEVTGLVNNAGITKDQLILRMKTDDFDNVINTNLKGTFLLCRSLAKSMLKARKGSIVNITSVIGLTGNAGQSNYAASKAGTIGFSKSLAQELGSRGVRVNCVAPGFISTEMTDVLNEDVKKKILEKIPLQTLGETQDIAWAVRFLLSDESKYVTGHTLSVNGGMFMQ